jgi:hypothetical protein
MPNSKSTQVISASQAWLDGLNFTANALLEAEMPSGQIENLMEDHVLAVNQATNRRVLFRNGRDDGIWFTFDESHLANGEYLRVRKPNDVTLLGAKINRVTVSLNLRKPHPDPHMPLLYDHDNDHIATALRALADLIEVSPIRLADQEHFDLRHN